MNKRRTGILLIVIAVTVCANAQTMYDALTFSQNNYEGTARTMAMGNAFTALGGDLGSVNINPAGSAVNKYSQVTITPGVTISVNNAGGTSSAYFSNDYKTNYTRFNMPNVGFTLNFDTHRQRGLKNWSLGIVANKTDSYANDLYTKGINSTTSFAGAMATLADGFSRTALTYTNSYDPYYNSNIPFDAILAFESGIIDNIYTNDSQGNEYQYDYDYVGVTENYFYDENGNVTNIGLGGAVDQTYARRTSGGKYDYVINFGGNINDIVYFGANLGLVSISYSEDYYLKESAAADQDLFQTRFSELRYSSSYSASGFGVYGKFGVIVTPGAGIRIGAAFQTPTAMHIHEEWMSAATMYTSSTYGSGNAETIPGDYSYKLVSPLRFNVGLAYALGRFGIISADYEMCNYGSARFKATRTYDNSEFEAVNNDIKTYMGVEHYFRVGLEIKPIEQLAVRLGYGFTTSPEKYYDNGNSLKYVSGQTNRYAIGLGYSSKRSFFMDVALQVNQYIKEYIYPYDYYYYYDGAPEIKYIDTGVDTPEILSKRQLYNVVLTLGWRF